MNDGAVAPQPGPAPPVDGGTALFVFDDVGVDAPDGTTILHGVHFRVPHRGITVLLGPSGAGKSTLLRLCNRLAVASRGRVTLRGADVRTLDPLRLRRRVGMVFQTPTMLGGTVRDNLLVAAPDADATRLSTALRRAALDVAVLDRAADTLSGGEAQRVSLARTLVAEPEVLLLDEPTSALDARPRAAFERVAVDLAHHGMPMLWVTHDLAQARRLGDHVVVVAEGRVVFTGTPAALADHPARAVLVDEQDGHEQDGHDHDGRGRGGDGEGAGQPADRPGPHGQKEGRRAG